MSLKAKIEAVIYASEEPVTLAQLMGLLGEEAQSELDALAAQQQSLALDDDHADDQDTLNAEALEPAEAGEVPEVEVAAAADSPAAESAQEPSSEPESPLSAGEVERLGAFPGSDDNLGGPEPALSSPKGLDSETGEAAPTQAEEAETPATTAPEASPPKESAADVKARARALRDHFRSLLNELIADYAQNDRGLEIREVAGGFRLATKPEYHDAVRGFVKSLKPPLKLSLQALETLAVIAYKQPVTAPEISEIRGVDSGGVLGSLLARKLITTAGRKQVIGRPILYKTTKDFLVRFGLKDINELPSIEEFEKMAGELNDAVQEEIPMDASDAPRGNSSEEDDAAGTPTSLDELNAVPEPTYPLHESVEDIMSDDSSAPEGSDREPIQPDQVEPIGDTHTPQADGTPDGSTNPADDPDADETLAEEKQEDLETSTPG